MVVRWIAANLASNGEHLPISFNGSALGYIGWDLLMYVSVISIIGWAWVITAWMRWNCRNIGGTQREVIFIASGLEMLWRTIVFRDRLRVHHPDPVGDALVRKLVRVAIRARRPDRAEAARILV